jgi:hypothetical protein
VDDVSGLRALLARCGRRRDGGEGGESEEHGEAWAPHPRHGAGRRLGKATVECGAGWLGIII